MSTRDGESPTGSYSEVIDELAALATHAQDPEARATFELLAKMFRTLSAGHDTFTTRDCYSHEDPSKPQ